MRPERLAALGGLVFVVLTLATIPLSGNIPQPDASAKKVSEWLSDNHSGIQATAVLWGFSAVALAWWFGAVWRAAVKAEDGRAQLAVTSLVGLGLMGTFFGLNVSILSAMAMHHGEEGASMVLWAFSGVAMSLGESGLAIMAGSMSVLILRGKLFTKWLAYVGFVAAVLALVATVGAGNDAPVWFYPGLPAFMLWAVWILGISWDLWRKPELTA